MKRLSAGDLKDLNLLKHYRIIRKWACKNNGLNDADLELLIYLDCIDMFTIKDFKIATQRAADEEMPRLIGMVEEIYIFKYVLGICLFSS